MAIRFVIAGVPVAKERPRFTRSGHAYTPAKTRTYEEIVRLHATQAMRGKKMLSGAIELRVTAYLPIPKNFPVREKARALSGTLPCTKKPDWDNLGKIISDACNRIVYRDDAQICDSYVAKRYSAEPRVDVIIRGTDGTTL